MNFRLYNMYLNIILQILIGISALLVVYLDYKWYDKRRIIFKKARKYLILITALIIGLSISATILQDNEKNILSQDISSLQDSITSINGITRNLNEQIEPFLKLALDKYPNLPINDALKKLQFEINAIQEKTKELEFKEQGRKKKEAELEKLKITPPDVEFNMGIVENDLKIFIKFNNQVPIKFYPFLINYGPWECGTSKIYDIFRKAYIEPIVIYPPKDENKWQEFVFDSVEKNEELPRDKLLCLRMKIIYSSIYANEIQLSKLKEKEINLDYTIDPNTYEFKSTKFKQK